MLNARGILDKSFFFYVGFSVRSQGARGGSLPEFL